MKNTGGPASETILEIWKKVYADHFAYTSDPAKAVLVANHAISNLGNSEKDRDLLDYFAGQALAGQITYEGMEGIDVEFVAGCAYDLAEAMIAEKAKREAGE